VEAGTSFDVFELDAASNNGVQEIRDIIDAAALTSPGRHRVYILDDVHMLTRGAEAALLKTLEEPPEQVVFVLATTDPQKVSETIRSRVQHLQFHLLPMDELEKYVRHVAEAAQLEVTDEDIAMVLRQGRGSARDTLSALELVVAGGADREEAEHTEQIVQGIVARDHGAALAAIARAMQQGRDAQTCAQDVVRMMRDCFLAMMSPELVMLPADRVQELSGWARELGAQRIVRVMETLGTTLVEMRHAPDPRLLLEVAVVQLSSPSFDDSTENLLARIAQLEESVKKLKESGVGSGLPPVPVNPATGKAKIGGLAKSAPAPSRAAASASDVTGPTASPTKDPTAETRVDATGPTAASETEQPSAPGTATGDPAQLWPQITDSMKGLARAMFRPAIVESFDGKQLTVKLPPNTPVKKAEEQSKVLVAAIKDVVGLTCRVIFTVSDPTSGTERPRVDDTPATIDKIVAADPLAPIDLSETVPVDNAVDPMLEVMQSYFPQGSVVDDDSATGR
jgi:DNA polymerase-3 subunit gamma/tau